jgi:hypothetical protein
VNLITIVLFTATATFAQLCAPRMPVTHADRFVDALHGSPVFVTKDATLLDWPSMPGGKYRVLRKGSSQWACPRPFLAIRTMSRGASTAFSCPGFKTAAPGARRASIESASRCRFSYIRF